jgi:hypothetical protein
MWQTSFVIIARRSATITERVSVLSNEDIVAATDVCLRRHHDNIAKSDQSVTYPTQQSEPVR